MTVTQGPLVMTTAAVTRIRGSRRPGPILIGAIIAVVFIIVAVIGLHGMDAMKRRTRLLSEGMSQQQVEEILGAPLLKLPRSQHGTGELLVWTDHYWQIEVVIDEDGNLMTYSCVPANSAFRRTQKKLSSLFQ